MSEKNPTMEAINSMKAALSQIEKSMTMQHDTGIGEQDGNIGQAKDGVQGFSDDFQNLAKKKRLKEIMAE